MRRTAPPLPLPLLGGEFGDGDQLRLVGHVGQGHLPGTLHIGQHAVHAGGADEDTVLGHHTYQRDGIAIIIYYLDLLRLCAHGSHQGDCGHQENLSHCFVLYCLRRIGQSILFLFRQQK